MIRTFDTWKSLLTPGLVNIAKEERLKFIDFRISEATWWALEHNVKNIYDIITEKYKTILKYSNCNRSRTSLL